MLLLLANTSALNALQLEECMLGSDFVDVMSQVEWGRICCEPLLNYSNLLHENSVETLHKLGQLMQNYSACPANVEY